MTSGKKDPALDAQHQAVIRQLLARPENRTCADCAEPHPRWASVNLGVFLCITCSGYHRKMGTHVSVVRSTTLDSWTPQQIARVSKLGNAKVNAIFEACLDNDTFRRPHSSDSYAIEKFIRNKYETRKWLSKELGGGGGANTNTATTTTRNNTATTTTRNNTDNYNMTYTNNNYSSHHTRSRHTRATEYKAYDPPRRGGTLSASFQRTDAVSKIVEMGFTSGEAALALDDAGGSLSVAVEALLANQKLRGHPAVSAQSDAAAPHIQPQLVDLFASPPAAAAVAASNATDNPATASGNASGEQWADFGAFESAPTAAGPVAANTAPATADLTSKLGSLYLQAAAVAEASDNAATLQRAAESKTASSTSEPQPAADEQNWWAEPSVPLTAPKMASTSVTSDRFATTVTAATKVEPAVAVDNFFDDLIPAGFGKKK